jgi:hypothetical protein
MSAHALQRALHRPPPVGIHDGRDVPGGMRWAGISGMRSIKNSTTRQDQRSQRERWGVTQGATARPRQTRIASKLPKNHSYSRPVPVRVRPKPWRNEGEREVVVEASPDLRKTTRSTVRSAHGAWVHETFADQSSGRP